MMRLTKDGVAILLLVVAILSLIVSGVIMGHQIDDLTKRVEALEASRPQVRMPVAEP